MDTDRVVDIVGNTILFIPLWITAVDIVVDAVVDTVVDTVAVVAVGMVKQMLSCSYRTASVMMFC